MNLIDRCRTLIALESTPSHGNRPVAEQLAQWARQSGAQDIQLDLVTRHGVDEGNFLARFGEGASGRPLILQAHLDTMDPGNFSAWTRTGGNPFSAAIYQDELVGLGASAGKVEILAQLAALQALGSASLRRPIYLVGTFGRHSGMAGVIRLLRRRLWREGDVVVAAPTGLKVATSGNGEAVFEITIDFTPEEREWRQNHDLLESTSTQSKVFVSSGESAKESNPIIRMFEYMAQLPEGLLIMDMDAGTDPAAWPASAVLEVDIAGGLVSQMPKRLAWLLELFRESENWAQAAGRNAGVPLAIHVGTVRADSESLKISGIVRVPPQMSVESYNSWLEQTRRACHERGVEFRICDFKPGFVTDAGAELVRQASAAIQNLGLESGLQHFGGSSEAGVFHRLGFTCLAFGAGRSVGDSHRPNESVKIKDLERSAEFYGQLIGGLCL